MFWSLHNWYPVDGRLGEPHRQSTGGCKEKNPASAENNSSHPGGGTL